MATQTLSEMRDEVIARSAEDQEFRAKLIADPNSVLLEEFGVVVPERFNIHVHEDGATTAHFVLPRSARLTEEELALVAAGGDDWKSDAGYPPESPRRDGW